MKIHKFQAASMREALAKVKADLGPDAMVISTRQIRRGLLGTGVEVSAAIDTDDEAPMEPAFTASGKSRSKEPPVPSSLREDDVERIMAPLRSELRWLRTMMRSSSESTDRADVRAELQEMRRLIESAQNGEAANLEGPTLRDLARSNKIAAPSQGRIVALIGPTGVGKTTTIAKLAAKAALVEGQRVALITLDNYRVGGAEQLRIFADLIGISLSVVNPGDRLADHIEALGERDLILIDTAGRSPRDLPAIAQLESALRGVEGLEIHLAIPATLSASAIDTIVKRYGKVRPHRLLFTKVDEADDLGELVRAPARVSLPISYITTGQAVPEDIEVATTSRLLELAARGVLIQGIAA